MGHTPWWDAAKMTGEDYDSKFAALERTGMDMHGEADFVMALGVKSVLDAGCGTGRVAIELARRGIDTVGVDRDANMLKTAREKAPHLTWHLDDLATFTLTADDGTDQPRRFEAVVMAGNVMIFLDAGAEEAVVRNLARHLAPGGLLVAGFQLMPDGLRLAQYDAYAAGAGLELQERWSTWNRDTWRPASDYTVSVHRRPRTDTDE